MEGIGDELQLDKSNIVWATKQNSQGALGIPPPLACLPVLYLDVDKWLPVMAPRCRVCEKNTEF